MDSSRGVVTLVVESEAEELRRGAEVGECAPEDRRVASGVDGRPAPTVDTKGELRSHRGWGPHVRMAWAPREGARAALRRRPSGAVTLGNSDPSSPRGLRRTGSIASSPASGSPGQASSATSPSQPSMPHNCCAFVGMKGAIQRAIHARYSQSVAVLRRPSRDPLCEAPTAPCGPRRRSLRWRWPRRLPRPCGSGTRRCAAPDPRAHHSSDSRTWSISAA